MATRDIRLVTVMMDMALSEARSFAALMVSLVVRRPRIQQASGRVDSRYLIERIVCQAQDDGPYIVVAPIHMTTFPRYLGLLKKSPSCQDQRPQSRARVRRPSAKHYTERFQSPFERDRLCGSHLDREDLELAAALTVGPTNPDSSRQTFYLLPPGHRVAAP
jgi:hypothetical protein